MDNNEVKILIEAFRGYRDLLNPIQSNLNDFIETYELMRENIDKLNSAFGGEIKENLEKIYKNLAGQAEKASDLSSRIDKFTTVTGRYISEVSNLLTVFGRVEEKISAVNELENRAEEQIGRLDAILEEKNKNYNVKELQKTLDSYNKNVQKMSEFINRDVADSLAQSHKKIEVMKDGIEDISRKQREENINIEKMLETYTSTAEMMKRISEKQDVNEIYIFEILDKWAASRKVRTKKTGKE